MCELWVWHGLLCAAVFLLFMAGVYFPPYMVVMVTGGVLVAVLVLLGTCLLVLRAHPLYKKNTRAKWLLVLAAAMPILYAVLFVANRYGVFLTVMGHTWFMMIVLLSIPVMMFFGLCLLQSKNKQAMRGFFAMVLGIIAGGLLGMQTYDVATPQYELLEGIWHMVEYEQAMDPYAMIVGVAGIVAIIIAVLLLIRRLLMTFYVRACSHVRTNKIRYSIMRQWTKHGKN